MTYRTFTDTDGRKWEVWLVVPTRADRRDKERRIQRDRRAVARTSSDRRRTPRRSRAEPVPVLVAPDYENGWLCFESNGEKRRLVPIPPQWERAGAEQLLDWCTSAKRVTRTGSPSAD